MQGKSVFFFFLLLTTALSAWAGGIAEDTVYVTIPDSSPAVCRVVIDTPYGDEENTYHLVDPSSSSAELTDANLIALGETRDFPDGYYPHRTASLANTGNRTLLTLEYWIAPGTRGELPRQTWMYTITP